jgi:DNA gyrase inhibitor GyrI
MLTEPKVVERAPQPFAAVVLDVRQSEISQKAPPRIADVIAWIKAHGGRTAGPPFFNYVEFYPGGRMRMQVGMPVAEAMAGDAGIATGRLPGGRYASVTHTGPYHELMDANMALDAWARERGLRFAGEETADGFRGATRLEIYHRDPGEDVSGEPVTEVAFRLAA